MLQYVAEFEATAENGFIRLPADLPELANAPLRIIIFPQPVMNEANTADTARQARLERLRLAQARLVELNPFRDIADPVQWQRELREENDRTLPERS